MLASLQIDNLPLVEVVLGSPVQSSLLPIFGRIETGTSPHLSQTGLDHKRPVFSGPFAVFCGLFWFKTSFIKYYDLVTLYSYVLALI
jgi:hypothetical protein